MKLEQRDQLGDFAGVQVWGIWEECKRAMTEGGITSEIRLNVFGGGLDVACEGEVESGEASAGLGGVSVIPCFPGQKEHSGLELEWTLLRSFLVPRAKHRTRHMAGAK